MKDSKSIDQDKSFISIPPKKEFKKKSEAQYSMGATVRRENCDYHERLQIQQLLDYKR
jgi:hypothetical protein